MPGGSNIEQFDAGPGKITPNDIGQQAAVMAGRRVGEFYHQMGQDFGNLTREVGSVVDDYVYQHERARMDPQLLSAYAGAREGITKAVQENPNDPEIVPKIISQWSDSMNDYRTNLRTSRGQQAFDQQNEMYSRELTSYSMSAISAQSAVLAHQSILATTNQASSLAHGDLTQIPLALSQTAAVFDPAKINPNGRISAEESAKLMDEKEGALKSVLVQGVMGAVERGVEQGRTVDPDSAEFNDPTKNPLAAIKQKLQDPNFYPDIIGTDRGQLQAEVDRGFDQARTAWKGAQNQQDKAMEEAGAAAFAQLDGRVQAQLRPNAPPDPNLQRDITAFGSQFGRIPQLSGHISALNAGMTAIASPAKERGLIPDNTPTATAMINGLGGPNEANEAQISQAEYRGDINEHVATILREGMRLAKDPANKEAIDEFHRAQQDAAEAIMKSGSPFAALVVNQMRSDSQAIFNARLQQVGPGETVKIMRDATNPQNFFGHMIPEYVRAAQQGGYDPIGWMQKNLPGYQNVASGTLVNYGGPVISPTTGPTNARASAVAAPAGTPVSADRLKGMAALAGGH